MPKSVPNVPYIMSNFEEYYKDFEAMFCPQILWIFLFYNLQNLIKAESGLDDDFGRRGARPRSSTVNESRMPSGSQALPVVFKWDGAGKDIYLSGSFNNWQRIPMNKR